MKSPNSAKRLSIRRQNEVLQDQQATADNVKFYINGKELERVKNELSKLENRYGRLVYAIPDEFSGRSNPVKDMVEVLNECRERLAGVKGFED